MQGCSDSMEHLILRKRSPRKILIINASYWSRNQHLMQHHHHHNQYRMPFQVQRIDWELHTTRKVCFREWCACGTKDWRAPSKYARCACYRYCEITEGATSSCERCELVMHGLLLIRSEGALLCNMKMPVVDVVHHLSQLPTANVPTTIADIPTVSITLESSLGGLTADAVCSSITSLINNFDEA